MTIRVVNRALERLEGPLMPAEQEHTLLQRRVIPPPTAKAARCQEARGGRVSLPGHRVAVEYIH